MKHTENQSASLSAGQGSPAPPLLGAVEIRLPYKRKQRWLGLQYRWRNARWPGEQRHHFAVFNAVMKVPQFMRDKFFRRECKRLGISGAAEIITIENNMTGDTIWSVKAPNNGTQRPGTPDGSLATETRRPGSLK